MVRDKHGERQLVKQKQEKIDLQGRIVSLAESVLWDVTARVGRPCVKVKGLNVALFVRTGNNVPSLR